MDDSGVFLIRLNSFAGVQVPYMDQFIVTGYHVGSCR